jgi:hypothetical protein
MRKKYSCLSYYSIQTTKIQIFSHCFELYGWHYQLVDPYIILYIQKIFNKHYKLIPRQYQKFKIKSHVKRKKDSIHVYLRVNTLVYVIVLATWETNLWWPCRSLIALLIRVTRRVPPLEEREMPTLSEHPSSSSVFVQNV